MYVRPKLTCVSFFLCFFLNLSLRHGAHSVDPKCWLIDLLDLGVTWVRASGWIAKFHPNLSSLNAQLRVVLHYTPIIASHGSALGLQWNNSLYRFHPSELSISSSDQCIPEVTTKKAYIHQNCPFIHLTSTYETGRLQKAKKAISPQAKVTKKAMLKPCNNQTKPQPYPTLPQCHKIFTPGPNLPKRARPHPSWY